jgi:hypothetical protein
VALFFYSSEPLFFFCEIESKCCRKFGDDRIVTREAMKVSRFANEETEMAHDEHE